MSTVGTILTEEKLKELQPNVLTPRLTPRHIQTGDVDLNELTQGGIYLIRTGTVLNAPPNATVPAMVIVLQTTTDGILLQVYVNRATMGVFIRFCYWNWENWKHIG